MSDTATTMKTDLGKVTTAPEDRLAELQAEKDRRDKAKRVYDAGFDDEDHYDAWQTLEELRALTKALRAADSPSTRHKYVVGFDPAAVGMVKSTPVGRLVDITL